MKSRVLAVDDDLATLQAMEVVFKASHYAFDVSLTAADCLSLIKRNPIAYSLVFVDHNLGENGQTLKGDVLARQIKNINPAIMVVMVSGDRSEDVLKSWLEAGVDQFLIKPTRAHELISIADNAQSRYESNYALSRPNDSSPKNRIDAEALRKVKMISNSESMVKVAQAALRYSGNNYNVLILGETGTGKEVLAEAIHQNSALSKKPFLPINCSSYQNSDSLLESELFGHEKGAFTGADKVKIGIFEAAAGGVVFLDEVHHLSPSAQAKLLRVVQHRKVRRVGGTAEIPVNFRLISAGKPELKQLCLDGSFTLDLLYRIKELVLEIPPLRSRPSDVLPLIYHFKSIYEHDLNLSIEFAESALVKLQEYSWPGNVRELAAVVKELLVTASGPVIRESDLSEQFRDSIANLRRGGKLMTLSLLIAEQELAQKQLIARMLKECDYNVSRAAQNLDVARSTLRDLMKRYSIADEEVSQSPAKQKVR